MYVRCRKTITNMSNKLIFHSNFKLSLLYVTVPKALSTSPCFRASQHDSYTIGSNYLDLKRVESLNPTRNIIRRGYSTDEGENDKFNEENSLKNITITKTFPFLFKFLLAKSVDGRVKDHINHDFIVGAKSAFHHVTDCLYRKDFEELTDVMTPELFEKLKNEEIAPSILKSPDIKFITFTDIHWEVDRKKAEKTLEVSIQFLFLTEPQDAATSNMNLFSLARNLKQESIDPAVVYVGSFKFIRKYGKTIKDTPWMLTGVKYFNIKEAVKF